jgi:pyruvate/2-oxoglutarate dehydrogenase complex dihydrolipoamide acyltransferase (E2) component
MATVISIPKLGVSMEEGTLVAWLVPDGATVAAGDAIYRIETDKVESDVEAPVAGVLHHTGVEGETYDVGTPVGTID